MLNHLTEKDMQEGREIAEIFSKLPETEKTQVKIYTQALADRNEIQKRKQEQLDKEGEHNGRKAG